MFVLYLYRFFVFEIFDHDDVYCFFCENFDFESYFATFQNFDRFRFQWNFFVIYRMFRFWKYMFKFCWHAKNKKHVHDHTCEYKKTFILIFSIINDVIEISHAWFYEILLQFVTIHNDKLIFMHSLQKFEHIVVEICNINIRNRYRIIFVFAS